MEESLATQKTDVANSAFVQDVESATELIGVYPAQVMGGDFTRAKLQKSQAALHEFVTAMLQRAGPPRRMSRSMSQVLDAIEVKALPGRYAQPSAPAIFLLAHGSKTKAPRVVRRGFINIYYEVGADEVGIEATGSIISVLDSYPEIL